MTLPLWIQNLVMGFRNLFDLNPRLPNGTGEYASPNNELQASTEHDGHKPIYSAQEITGEEYEALKTHGPVMEKKAGIPEGYRVAIEPDTIRQKLPLSDIDFDKYMAMYLIETTNGPFEDFQIFSAVAFALNGVKPNFEVLQIPEVPWIWHTVGEMKRLRPKMGLSYEIQAFIKVVSDESGYHVYPEWCDDIYPSKYQSNATVLAKEGPFPLEETVYGIQASKLLEIESYLNRVNT